MHAKLRGRKIAWDEQGRGTPLVLLHAFPFDRRMWRDLAADLSLDARVLTPDFAGLGESEGQATIDEAADDVLALLDHVGVERAVVGGMSMGGYVSLAFARRHPSRLLGLLLSDTRANADSVDGRRARDEGIARIAREGAAPYIKDFVPRLLTGRDPKARDYALAIALHQNAIGVAGALASLRDRPDATPDLPRIAVPTTVVVGAEDTLTSPTVARALAEGIPGAEYVEIPNAGHLPVLEARAAFAEAVRSLLRRLEFRSH